MAVNIQFFKDVDDPNYRFPEESDKKKEFLSQFGTAVRDMQGASLAAIEEFRDRVVKILPKEMIKKGEKTKGRFPAKFYLWSKKHPVLSIVVKILSLGVLAIIGYIGKKQLNTPHYKAHLHHASLQQKINDRQKFLNKVKDKKLEKMPLEERAAFVAKVVRDKGKMEDNAFDEIKRNIEDHAKEEWGSPGFWEDEENIEFLLEIYDDMECDGLVEELNKKNEIYSEVQKWDNLSLNEQLNLVNTLLQPENREIFKDQLAVVCKKTNENFKIEKLQNKEKDENRLFFGIVTALCSVDQGRELKENLDLLGKQFFEKYTLPAYRNRNTGLLWNLDQFHDLIQMDDPFPDDLHWYLVSTYTNRYISYDEKVLSKVLAEHRDLFDKEIELVIDNISSLASNLNELTIEGIQRTIKTYLIYEPFLKEQNSLSRKKIERKILNVLVDRKSWKKEEKEMMKKIFSRLSMNEKILEKPSTKWRELAGNSLFIMNFCDSKKDDWKCDHFRYLYNTYPKIFECEFDNLRKTLFDQVLDLNLLSWNEIEKLIINLQAIEPIFEKGVQLEFLKAKMQILSLIKEEKNWDDTEFECVKRVFALLSVKKVSLQDVVQENPVAKAYIQTLGFELRNLGQVTEIADLPSPNAKFDPDHLRYSSVMPKPFNGNVNIKELLDYLEKDPYEVVPDVIFDPDSPDDALEKNDVIGNLQNYFNKLLKLEKKKKLEKGQPHALNILKHYTERVNQRLAEVKDDVEESRLVYVELVEYILKMQGFATYHCDDRKFSAAMAIFREKLIENDAEESVSQSVKNWIASKRSALVGAILRDMIVGDISSAIVYWKNQLKDELRLGDQPPSNHNLDGGLNSDAILQRFKVEYTPDWIINLAIDEYNKPAGKERVFMNDNMFDFLKSRFENMDDFMDECFDDETYALKREAMVLYLQECGVFSLG